MKVRRMKRLRKALPVVVTLLLPSSLSAQEMSTGTHDLKADTNAIAQMMDAKNTAVLAILQAMTTCQAKLRFYKPGAAADADGCAEPPSLPSSTIAAFNLARCPTGWNELPGLAGRFVVGVGTLGTDSYALGQTGGSSRHRLTVAEMPSHNHGFVDRYPGRSAPVQDNGETSKEVIEIDRSAVTERNGGGLPHENRPPFVALRYCIKA